MKKIFIAISAVLMLAAGCSSSTNNTTNTANITSPTDSVKTYSMDQVTAANTEAKCWTVIRGEVYDLTSYIKSHPGGKANIMRACGVDGTSVFDAQHQGQGKPENQLKKLQIGALK